MTVSFKHQTWPLEMCKKLLKTQLFQFQICSGCGKPKCPNHVSVEPVSVAPAPQIRQVAQSTMTPAEAESLLESLF